MTGFWIAATIMTVITLGALMFSVIRRGSADVSTRTDFDITVYKDQLKEVDRDLERGLLSETQAVSARTEIERRMLGAMDEIKTTTNSDKSPGAKNPAAVILLFALLLGVPLGAFGVYLSLGQPSMPDHPLASRATQLKETTEGRAKVAEMVTKLERQMAETPDDPNGWALLGRSYRAMGRFGDAVNALKKLVQLTNNDPEALVMLAEALVEMDKGSVSLEAVELLKNAQAVDPSDPRPYFYIGLERQQKGDLQGAANEWAELLNNSPANAQWVPEMQNRISKLVDENGLKAPKIVLLAPMPQSAPQQSNPSSANAQSNSMAPTRQQIEDAQQMNSGDQQALIRSMVERLAARLKENPDDVEGWKRLENAYRVLGETAKADEAKAQIKRLSGG